MIQERTYYKAICDNCGMSIGSFDARSYPGPQDVTRQLLERHQWTAFEELHHCFRCPPICASCGLDDVDCDCNPGSDEGALGQTGDSLYVSREPNVIATVDGRPAPALTGLLNFIGATKSDPIDGSALAAQAHPAPTMVDQCQPGGSCEYDMLSEYCRRCDVPEIEEHRRGEG